MINPTDSRTKRNIVRVLEALAHPMTREELAKHLFMSRATAGNYLRFLRAAPKRVYISGWKTDVKGRHAPIYALGRRADREEPPRQNKYKAHKARLRAEPGLRELLLQRRRLKPWKPKGPATWASALGLL